VEIQDFFRIFEYSGSNLQNSIASSTPAARTTSRGVAGLTNGEGVHREIKTPEKRPTK